MSPASSRSWVRAWSSWNNCSVGNLPVPGLQKGTTESKSSFLTQGFIKETARPTSCWMLSSTFSPFPEKDTLFVLSFYCTASPSDFPPHPKPCWRWRRQDLQKQRLLKKCWKESSEELGCVNADRNVSICLCLEMERMGRNCSRL